MNVGKIKKEYIRDYKKDKVAVMNRMLAGWGEDIYNAKGVTRLVDKVMNDYIPFSIELADKVEFYKGYKLNKLWFMCAIAQLCPSEATMSMFKQFNCDYHWCSKPKALPHETVEEIDYSSALGHPTGTMLVRTVLYPTEGYPPNCVVRSGTGKLYDVSTRDPNGDYRIVSHAKYKGKHRDFVITTYQIAKMVRIQ